MSEGSSAAPPAFYIPHGGGPCFFMTWTAGPPDTWDRMGAWLGQLGATLADRPAAIVIVSAHWETPVVAVTSAEQPPLIYDYYGFPQHTYALRYDAPGDPEIARDIVDRLNAAGIGAAPDPSRGFDHGVFIPLKVMFPEADIPVVQVSLHESLDPALHLAIGRALAPLRQRNILLIGSGMSYHNLPLMMSGAAVLEDSDRFDSWLFETCGMAPAARDPRLCAWNTAPAALDAHPRAEHLLPLMVAAGASADTSGRRIFSDRVMGSTVSAFAFD